LIDQSLMSLPPFQVGPCDPAPMEQATLTGLLTQRARHSAARTAYILLKNGEDPQASLSYAGLYASAVRLSGLLHRTAAPRTPVVLLYASSLDFIAAFWACQLAGNIAVPLPAPRSPQRLDALAAWVRSSGARTALTTSRLLERLEPHLAEHQLETLSWIVAECAEEEFNASPDLKEVTFALPPPHPNDPAVIQFTSGSTGRPKGVVLTHRNILANQVMIRDAFGHREHEAVVVSVLPHFHDMGLFGNLLQPFFLGGTCVLIPPEAFAQRPRRWLEAISRYRGTTSGGPNFAYELCVNRDNATDAPLDLSNWSLAFVGAEPVRAETMERFAASFARFGFRRSAFFPCYGLAEATLFVSGGRIKDAADGADNAAGEVSCGPVANGLCVAIIDPDNWTQKPPGQRGEVWLAGPSISTGYWQNLEATIGTFEGMTTDGLGPFMRTGDIGFLRGDQLFLCGRLRNIIIVNGANYHGEDLEMVASRAHASIAPGGCAALGLRSSSGEQIVIVAEPRRATRRQFDAKVAGEAIHRAIAHSFDVAPAEVIFVRIGTLPRTSSGKLRREACRQMVMAGSLTAIGRWQRRERPDDEHAVLDGTAAARVHRLIVAELARVLGRGEDFLCTDETFPELGLDSKDLFQLADRLSVALDLDFDPVLFWECPSIDRLARAIAELLETRATA